MWRILIAICLMLLPVLCCACQTGLISGSAQRPDGIDVYVEGAGFEGLRTRRNTSPAEFLGTTPKISSPFAFINTDYPLHDRFVTHPVLTINVPDSAEWDPGNDQIIDIEGRSAKLSANINAALADAEASVGTSLEQKVILHETRFMRLRKEWIHRRPSRKASDEELDDLPIVSELMQAKRFSIVRRYKSPSLALQVRDLVSRRLGIEGASVTANATSDSLRITIQNTPLLLGVKLSPLRDFAPKPGPNSRGNFDIFKISPLADVIDDPQDPQVYCTPVAVAATGVTRIAPANLRAVERNEGERVTSRQMNVPLRLDVIESGQYRYPQLLTNYLLQEIAPQDVAFCQVTFRNPTEYSLDPKLRRAYDGGVSDESVLLTHVIGGEEYEVSAYFYEDEMAARYEARLRQAGVSVSRRYSTIDAIFRPNRFVAVGARTAAWQQLQNATPATSKSTFYENLPGETGLWLGSESPQQLVLRRGSDLASITQESTPYLSATKGSTAVLADSLKGQELLLVRHGRPVCDDEIVSRILGSNGLDEISTVSFSIRRSTVAQLDPAGFERIYPRGVWADTTSEHLVVHAFSIDVVDLAIETASLRAAQRIGAWFQSRFEGCETSIEAATVTVANADLSAVDALRFVSVVPLDEFLRPHTSPVSKSAGTEVIGDNKYLELGKTGFGLSLSLPPNVIYQWYGPVGSELSNVGLNAQLYMAGVAYGSRAYVECNPGIIRVIAYDVPNDEVLEVEIEAVRIVGNSDIGCSVSWRLTGKPKPMPPPQALVKVLNPASRD